VHPLVRTPFALCLYVVVASITPGPNNLMLINMGVVRGHRAAAGTALGVTVGFAIQVLVFSLGVGAAIKAVPGLTAAIDVIGLAYLLWLASKLLAARSLGAAAPMHGFTGAIRYQWINPKAISMALTTAGLFVVASGPRVWASALAVAAIAAVCCLPCTLIWGLGGASMSDRLKDEHAVVTFNRLSAAALLAMVVWLAATMLAS